MAMVVTEKETSAKLCSTSSNMMDELMISNTTEYRVISPVVFQQ